MKIIIILLLIALFNINFCKQSPISSEDQKCRELYLSKHVDTPQETCAQLLAVSNGTGASQKANDLALLNCFLYLEKWKNCGDQSPIKPVLIKTE